MSGGSIPSITITTTTVGIEGKVTLGGYTLDDDSTIFAGRLGASMYANANCNFTPAPGYYAYIGDANSGSNKIQTSSSGPSSINVKKNLSKIDLNLVYEDIKNLNLYEFDYKYTGIKDKIHDFGFIIEEIESLSYLSQFTEHYTTSWYKQDDMLIKKYSDEDLDIYENFETKEWDRDTYIKLNMVMTKSLQIKITELEDKVAKLEALIKGE